MRPQEEAAKRPFGGADGWSLTSHSEALTTPALRATPPMLGGEFSLHRTSIHSYSPDRPTAAIIPWPAYGRSRY
jgi:hypothetical protein